MHQEIAGWNGGKIKAWVNGVEFDHATQQQVHNTAGLDFIHEHIAVMPDSHFGAGSTVGTVIPTKGAIIPAAVGVDIGCGMMAVRTSLTAEDLPDNTASLRADIERAVPHGGQGPSGGWGDKPGGIPNSIMNRWRGMEPQFRDLCARYPDFERGNSLIHLGSLGGGNHFVEGCLDEENRVWVMLHSGSRGIGNLIGQTFIRKARELLETRNVHLPDKDLAWLDEGTPEFRDYIDGMSWAQDFAMENRKAMMERTLKVMHQHFPQGFSLDKHAINCHHNYANREQHFGEWVWLTRKGAVSAKKDELGIIPGSMGAKSFIVRGLGNADSFCSCSHGAGRKMTRGDAKRNITLEQHAAATAGVDCRKDIGVIDESPMAYKDIDAVMAAQSDLVTIEHTLKQFLCIKG